MNNLTNIVEMRDVMRFQTDRIMRNEEMIQHLLPYIGDYKMSARSNDYCGWMVCNGREVDRTTYSKLYDVIGTSFGATSSNTFKLPDFRGKVIGQPGTGIGLTARAFGDSVGSETHTLSTTEIPSHTHGGTTFNGGDHAHTATTANAGAHSHPITDPGHAHTQTTINDDFNSSGASPPGFAADSAGTRTWNNINSSTTGVTVDSAGTHAHDVTVASAGSHAHSFVTNAAGGGQAHNIMQPTLFGAHVFIFTGVVTS